MATITAVIEEEIIGAKENEHSPLINKVDPQWEPAAQGPDLWPNSSSLISATRPPRAGGRRLRRAPVDDCLSDESTMNVERGDELEVELVGCIGGIVGKNIKDPQAQSDHAKLLRATVLCFLFMVGEAVGGYFSGSLAILTDAAHLFSDVAAMVISISAIGLAQRKPTMAYSWGFHRAEILGAIGSVLMIWMLTGVLVYQAILRMITPTFVDGRMMLIIGCIGLVVNLLMLFILGGHFHGGKQCDGDHGDGARIGGINVSAAYIHVLGDLLQTCGVIIAAALIWTTPIDVGYFACPEEPVRGCTKWLYMDPLCTCVFAIFVMLTTKNIAKECIETVMHKTPSNIDIEALQAALQRIDSVKPAGVKDLHVWSITTGKHACSLRLQLCTNDPRGEVLTKAHRICQQYNCGKTVIQIETPSFNVRVMEPVAAASGCDCGAIACPK